MVPDHDVRYLDIWPGAPLPPTLLIPRCILDQLGISPTNALDEDAKRQLFPRLETKFAIVKRFLVPEGSDYQESLEIAFVRGSSWKTIRCGREVICSASKLTSLAKKGFPVNSNNATLLVNHFDAFEKANLDNIPVVHLTDHLGWQDRQSFMHGTKQMMPAGSHSNVIELNDTSRTNLVAMGASLRTSGTYQGWLDAVQPLMYFPRPLLFLLSSLSAPFMEPLEIGNFIVELAASTSTSKSTQLMVAASAYGNPDLHSQNTMLRTWNMTGPFLDRFAAMHQGIPLLLDDTKTAQSPNVLGDFVYRFTSGNGRGRGTAQGVQRSNTWRTILLSTGEQPLVDYLRKHVGAKARVLILVGPPLGTGNHATLVGDVTRGILQNYGHAAPLVIQRLLNNLGRIDVLKETYFDRRHHYSELAGGNHVAQRLSEKFAFLDAVAPMIIEALPGLVLPRSIQDIFADLWTDIAGVAQNSDVVTDALVQLWEFFSLNADKFHDPRKKNQKNPQGAWRGRIDAECLSIPTCVMQEKLGKHEVQGLMRTMASRGFLKTSGGGNNTRNVTIGGRQVVCYSIYLSVIERELGL